MKTSGNQEADQEIKNKNEYLQVKKDFRKEKERKKYKRKKPGGTLHYNINKQTDIICW